MAPGWLCMSWFRNIEKVGDLEEMLARLCLWNLNGKATWGIAPILGITSSYVQNEWVFWTIRKTQENINGAVYLWTKTGGNDFRSSLVMTCHTQISKCRPGPARPNSSPGSEDASSAAALGVGLELPQTQSLNSGIERPSDMKTPNISWKMESYKAYQIVKCQ